MADKLTTEEKQILLSVARQALIEGQRPRLDHGELALGAAIVAQRLALVAAPLPLLASQLVGGLG